MKRTKFGPHEYFPLHGIKFVGKLTVRHPIELAYWLSYQECSCRLSKHVLKLTVRFYSDFTKPCSILMPDRHLRVLWLNFVIPSLQLARSTLPSLWTRRSWWCWWQM